MTDWKIIGLIFLSAVIIGLSIVIYLNNRDRKKANKGEDKQQVQKAPVDIEWSLSNPILLKWVLLSIGLSCAIVIALLVQVCVTLDNINTRLDDTNMTLWEISYHVDCIDEDLLSIEGELERMNRASNW